jgi:hypothetical protein
VRLFIAPLVLLLSAIAGAEEPAAIERLDPAMAVPDAEGGLLWFKALDIGLEGQAWDELAHPFDRLPAKAEGVVTNAVWSLSQQSSGIAVRFVTNSPQIAARWSLRTDRLEMNHMPATGVSGLDLYARDGERFRWVGVGRPEKQNGNETTLIDGVPEGEHEYLLYLPLYNGIESLEIGIASDAGIAKAPPRPAARAKPILFWGTSILHGGCASRPGMSYPAILGRKLNREIYNLGFSGNGKMDPELGEIIADREAAAFVIDCAPNMSPELITERTEPLVHTLRRAQPDTPIVLVENIVYQQGWFDAQRKQAYIDKNIALKAAYDRLLAEGVTGLHYVPCDELLGDDSEATVDGTHPTDVGFLRMAEALEPVLRGVLEAK